MKQESKNDSTGRNQLEKTQGVSPVQSSGGRDATSSPSLSTSAAIFRRLHEAATLPLYNTNTGTFTLFMCDLTETGRPNVIVIPPHNLSRAIPTGLAIVNLGGGVGFTLSRGERMGEGLFAPSVPVVYGRNSELKVHLFNARHEAKRLMHGEPILDLGVIFGGGLIAGPARWDGTEDE